MKKDSGFRRLLAALLLAGLVGVSGVRAQNPESESETALLRERVAELEAQNAAILKQLSAIQDRLDQVASSQRDSAGNEVASLAPILPPAILKAPVTAIAVAPPQAAASTQQATEVLAEANKSLVTFYGMARLDAVFDDSQINNFQAPTAVRSEPTGAENQNNFTMHPRLTRFGVDYKVPTPLATMAGAKVFL